MYKNVPVYELNTGDIVRMAHLADGYYFMDMIVTKVTTNGIYCHRPYMLQDSNPTVGIEEVYFNTLGSTMLFNVLSLGNTNEHK